MQYLLIPSVSFERRFHLFDQLYLNLGARIGYYLGRTHYFYEGTWGYVGNGIDQFERVETNTVQGAKLYEGGKAALLMIPEWKIGNWTFGANFGLQYKRSSTMLFGQSAVQRFDSRAIKQNFGFRQEEVGFLTGLRISCELR